MRIRPRLMPLAVLVLLLAEAVVVPSTSTAAIVRSRTVTTTAASAVAPEPAPSTGISSTTILTTARDALVGAPLSFVPNVGQTNAQVAFMAQGAGYALNLTHTDAVIALVRQTGAPGYPPGDATRPLSHTESLSATAEIVRLHPVGVSADTTIAGQERLPGVANYFIGRDPTDWHSDVPTYAQVRYQGLYPGVDLVYYGRQGQLESDWDVAPGANPGAIQLAISGTRSLSLDGQGNLVMDTAEGSIEQAVPTAYQMIDGARQDVAVHYVITGAGTVGFALGAYDTGQPLVIDPVLSYGTYDGSGNGAYAQGVSVDAAGNAYMTGDTFTFDFPVSTTLYATNGGEIAAFVTKIGPSGQLLYSTFLGGNTDQGENSAFTYGYGIAVDAAGNTYVTGYTQSSDFPVTTNAYQQVSIDGQCGDNGASCGNAFLTKIDPAGDALLYSTLLSAGVPPIPVRRSRRIARATRTSPAIPHRAIFRSARPSMRPRAIPTRRLSPKLTRWPAGRRPLFGARSWAATTARRTRAMGSRWTDWATCTSPDTRSRRTFRLRTPFKARCKAGLTAS